jgi:hypothetical protein
MKSAIDTGGNTLKLSTSCIPCSELSARVPGGSVRSIQHHVMQDIAFRARETWAIRDVDSLLWATFWIQTTQPVSRQLCYIKSYRVWRNSTFASKPLFVDRRTGEFRHGSIQGYVAAVRQNAGKLAMICETRVLANCGYGNPICQTLNQAKLLVPFDRWPPIAVARRVELQWPVANVCFTIHAG